MLQFICLFIPSIIAVGITSNLQKRKVDLLYFIFTYSSYLVFINFMIFVLLHYMVRDEFLILNSAKFTNLFCIKYLFVSIILSIILPFVVEILRKNFKINLSFNERNKK